METETKVSLSSRQIRSHRMRVKLRILNLIWRIERQTKGYGAYQEFLVKSLKAYEVENCSKSYVIDVISELLSKDWITIGQKGAKLNWTTPADALKLKFPIEYKPNGRIRPFVLTQKARGFIQWFNEILELADQLWNMYQEAEEIIE